MAANFPPRTDFATRACNLSRQGFDLFRDLESLAQDYADLGYQQSMVADDLVGTLQGLQPSDILSAIGGIVALGALLDGNNGAYRIAFKVLSQYGA